MEDLTAMLARGLRSAFDANGVLAEIHHVGPVLQITPGVAEVHTVRDVLAGDWSFYDRLVVEALRRGIFLLPGGRLYLSTAHSAADIDETVGAFRDALAMTHRT